MRQILAGTIIAGCIIIPPVAKIHIAIWEAKERYKPHKLASNFKHLSPYILFFTVVWVQFATTTRSAMDRGHPVAQIVAACLITLVALLALGALASLFYDAFIWEFTNVGWHLDTFAHSVVIRRLIKTHYSDHVEALTATKRGAESLNLT